MVFSDAPRKRCAPCEQGLGQGPEAGAVTTALLADAKTHPVVLGLTTGVLVWFTTRMLDRVFFGGKR